MNTREIVLKKLVPVARRMAMDPRGVTVPEIHEHAKALGIIDETVDPRVLGALPRRAGLRDPYYPTYRRTGSHRRPARVWYV